MRDDRIYLLHIRDAMAQIFDYTREGKEAFLTDKKTQDAVIRNLEVMGEAAKNVTQDLRKRSPEVPWKQIAGMRDKVIHEYFGVNFKLIWDVVERELPALKQEIDRLLTGPREYES